MISAYLIYRRIAVAMEMAGATKTHARRCVAQYRAYLDIHASDPTLAWVPTPEADEALHTHLEMSSFDDDCRALLGHTLQHDPSFKGTLAFDVAWMRSADAFQARGEKVDPIRGGSVCTAWPD